VSLDASIERREAGGWRIVLPVRREDVSVEKRTVVYEEVEIRRELLEDTAPMAIEPLG
jgi:stress response protein YsnF